MLGKIWTCACLWKCAPGACNVFAGGGIGRATPWTKGFKGAVWEAEGQQTATVVSLTNQLNEAEKLLNERRDLEDVCDQVKMNKL